MSSRRIFLAIPAPAQILALQDELRSSNAALEKVKWTRNHNIHLTVYFIGNVAEEKFEPVVNIISPLISGQEEFTLNFDSLAFTPSSKPRMLWARFNKNSLFTNLNKKIFSALHELLPENKFHYDEPVPHITLARFHSFKNFREIKLPSNRVIPDIHVNYCELWETVNKKGQSDYVKVAAFSFR